MVTIRDMTESDAPAVSRIVSGGYAYLTKHEGYSADQAMRLQAERGSVASIQSWPPRWRCFVAESDIGIVGVLAVDRNEVEELWVDTSHHRKGIGTALFRKAEQIMSEQGFPDLMVHCSGSSMRPFYEAMGCVAVGVEPCPDGPLAGWPLTLFRKELITAGPNDQPVFGGERIH
jgi:GNAT superfamily N-acetyltransferase